MQFVVVNNTSEDEISSNSSGRASSSDEISCHGDPTFGVDVDEVDMDEVDVHVLLFERKEIHLVLETDTNLVFNAPFARSIYVLHLNVTVF